MVDSVLEEASEKEIEEALELLQEIVEELKEHVRINRRKEGSKLVKGSGFYFA
jgi:hypothetical protein